MHRRTFLKALPVTLASFASGCALARIDPKHVLVRSDRITSMEQESEILSRAKLSWTDDGKVRVLMTRGNAYERGYQHGKLLRREVQENIGYIYEQALRKFHFKDLFDEAYERMRPFIPQDYVDEMHGLAHGARMPLEVIHNVHVLADIGEWGGKKQIKKAVREMMEGTLATSCSNIGASGSATVDGHLYTVRILDWGLHKISKLHEFPLIHVSYPEKGVPNANIGWVGYLGAISGMNAAHITLGEMGYRDPDGETLSGIPMPFMMREVLTHAENLADVRRIIHDAVGTCSYVFMMSDGKTNEAEMYVKDRSRFVTFKPGADVHDTKEEIPGIKDIVYGGHYNEKMTAVLTENHGKLSPEVFMKLIPGIAMPSNFQNVIYDSTGLRFWVSNAASKDEWAASQPYTYFDLADFLKRQKASRT